MRKATKQGEHNIKVKTFTVKNSTLGLNLGVFHVNFSTKLNPVWVNQKKSKSSYETQFINNLLPDFFAPSKVISGIKVPTGTKIIMYG